LPDHPGYSANATVRHHKPAENIPVPNILYCPASVIPERYGREYEPLPESSPGFSQDYVSARYVSAAVSAPAWKELHSAARSHAVKRKPYPLIADALSPA